MNNGKITGQSFGEMCKLASGLSIVVLSLMLFSNAVGAADKSGESSSDFQKERAACMDGTSGQDQKTCLRELGAARGESKRGNLSDSPSAYQRNALSRCAMLPESDREDCARRVSGDGSTSGSVKSGGVYRETTTVVPAPPPAPMPAPVPPGPAGMQ